MLAYAAECRMTMEEKRLRFACFILAKFFRVLGAELGSTRGSA